MKIAERDTNRETLPKPFHFSLSLSLSLLSPMSSSSFLFRKSLPRRRPQQQQPCRTFVDARVKWVRERGLDHTVEREKHLRPMLALKNLIKTEPSNSLPISVAAEHKTHFSLPTRTIEFIRKYPSIFEEFLPPGVTSARPHVRLTPEVLHLDEEEQSIYETQSYRDDAADRLLKLLMLTRVNKLPLPVIDRLRWDLGLPHDYITTLISDYPDYFQVNSTQSSSSNKPVLALELVCWSDELAVSFMEKKAKVRGGEPNKKGMPLAFPLQYSRGYELEKKVKKWVDDWQKLPYISPYEDASHLQPKSDQADKWTVAVLHELLHLLIPKKTEKENILCLGDYLGLGSRFKRALVNHPGIFYVSNKIRTHTVVLREAYKRDLLLHKHPLMGMRYQYIHLMNKGKEEVKPVGATKDAKSGKPRNNSGAKEGEEEDEELNGLSGSESEDASDAEEIEEENENDDEDDDDEDNEDEEDEDEEMVGTRRGSVVGRGKGTRNVLQRNDTNRSLRSPVEAISKRKQPNMVGDRVPTPVSKREGSRRGRNPNVNPQGRSRYPSSAGGLSTERREASS